MSIQTLRINSKLAEASNSTDFTTYFSGGLECETKWNDYEICLYECRFVNFLENISVALNNQTFKYSVNGNVRTCTLRAGNYGSVDEINKEIIRWQAINGDVNTTTLTPLFNLEPNLATLKCEFIFNAPNVGVDLTSGNLFKLLGFISNKTYTYTGSNSNMYEGSDRADINNGVLAVNINLSIVDGIISKNGVISSSVFQGSINVSPGDINIIRPNIGVLLWFPLNVNSNRLFNLRTYLTDQDNVPLALNPSETVDYIFLLRQIQ